jgi:hypothetical protein
MTLRSSTSLSPDTVVGVATECAATKDATTSGAFPGDNVIRSVDAKLSAVPLMPVVKEKNRDV